MEIMLSKKRPFVCPAKEASIASSACVIPGNEAPPRASVMRADPPLLFFFDSFDEGKALEKGCASYVYRAFKIRESPFI